MALINDPSASRAVSVTPSDTVNIAAPSGTNGTKYLYIGGAGNVSAVTTGGDAVTLTALAVGVFHPISVKRVNATNTTATGILAIY